MYKKGVLFVFLFCLFVIVSLNLISGVGLRIFDDTFNEPVKEVSIDWYSPEGFEVPVGKLELIGPVTGDSYDPTGSIREVYELDGVEREGTLTLIYDSKIDKKGGNYIIRNVNPDLGTRLDVGLQLHFNFYGNDIVESNHDLEKCKDSCIATCEDETEGCKSECGKKCKEEFRIEGDIEEASVIFEEDDFEDITNKEVEEVLGDGGSINGVDRFFDSIFQSDLENMRERFAEIRTLIGDGKIDEARNLLEYYKDVADKLEKEVAPEDRDEAVKLSKVVRKAINDLEDKISKEGDFDMLSEKAKSVGVAAEIASKIKALCEELAKLDPSEYYSVCISGDDSPDWQKKLDKDLTDDQKKEAKKFGEIMSGCFKSSGQNCRCDEIPFPDFANACSEAASLATACEVKDDESACRQLDNLEMPRLPPHLQEIMDSLEGDVMDSKFDVHMPPECVEQGATTRKECAKVMVLTNAPPECKDALLEAAERGEVDKNVFENICDEIMMEMHAPDCAKKGITDPGECARFMDGFRGENRMDEGPRIDFNCKEIQNPTERLNCYDKATSQASSYKGFDDENYNGPCMTESDWKAKKQECKSLYGEHAGDEPVRGDSGQGYECVIDAKCVDFGQKFEDTKDRERECADRCNNEGKPWDFYGGNCVCKEGNYGGGFGGGGSSCDDCQSQCPGASGTGCGPNGCECYYNEPISSGGGSSSSSSSGDGSSGSSSGSSGGGEGESSSSSSSSGGGEGGSSSSSSSSGGGDDGNLVTGDVVDDSGGESDASSEPSGDSGGDNSEDGGGITGGAIGVEENGFLVYWYKRFFG